MLFHGKKKKTPVVLGDDGRAEMRRRSSDCEWCSRVMGYLPSTAVIHGADSTICQPPPQPPSVGKIPGDSARCPSTGKKVACVAPSCVGLRCPTALVLAVEKIGESIAEVDMTSSLSCHGHARLGEELERSFPDSASSSSSARSSLTTSATTSSPAPTVSTTTCTVC